MSLFFKKNVFLFGQTEKNIYLCTRKAARQGMQAATAHNV